MRIASLLLLACIGAQAQVPAGLLWRRNLSGILGQNPAQINAGDLSRFEQFLGGAGAYCSALTPADYAANRLMMRSMTAYVRTMNSFWRDSPMRASLGNLSSRISAFPCGFAGYQPEPLVFDPAAAPVPAEPPFAMQPPNVDNVAAADKETFSDLQARYRIDATRAASAWKSAAVMRANLATQGATLNAVTEAAVSRFQLLFGLAAGNMLDRRWDEVLENLQAAEAETAKVVKVVGR
jgi:hypothetical protein